MRLSRGDDSMQIKDAVLIMIWAVIFSAIIILAFSDESQNKQPETCTINFSYSNLMMVGFPNMDFTVNPNTDNQMNFSGCCCVLGEFPTRLCYCEG